MSRFTRNHSKGPVQGQDQASDNRALPMDAAPAFRHVAMKLAGSHDGMRCPRVTVGQR